MSVEEYKKKLRECRSEFECRRLCHYFWSSVEGSYEEILECLAATDRMAQAFATGEEGSPGANAPVKQIEEFAMV